MKIPDRIAEVTINDSHVGDGPYPPKGFVPFHEHELGTGDCFGLYWPFGRESEEPIICELWHDSWEMNPVFSSLARFLDHASDLDEDDYFEEPTLAGDCRSPSALTAAAKEDAGRGRVEDAIAHLELAVAVLPEYGAAWGALAQQYRRVKRFDDALRAVLRALLSPLYFGNVNENLVRWFQRQDSQDASLQADSLWQHRRDLCFSYGGSKENADYPILLRCVDEYERLGEGHKAILLFQRHSMLMMTETVSFQDRYGFSRDWFGQMQEEMFAQHLGSTRDWAREGMP
jgi:tetratricopeptide (TPR) repeat protein